MQANVGNVDRIIRIIVGLALLSMLFLVEGSLRWVGLVGIIPLATAFMRFCPLYSIFRINTAK
ncbi:MAG: DUF2892 domain-containing protein [Limnochordales bacterium]|nr:MAG: DUF2892 domain-containing protein [Bacillota bacterium]